MKDQRYTELRQVANRYEGVVLFCFPATKKTKLIKVSSHTKVENNY